MHSHCCRVSRHNSFTCIAGKVIGIERENVRHAVRLHGCRETRIMYLYTQHVEGDDKPTPLRVYSRCIRQSRKKTLNQAQQPIRIRSC